MSWSKIYLPVNLIYCARYTEMTSWCNTLPHYTGDSAICNFAIESKLIKALYGQNLS